MRKILIFCLLFCFLCGCRKSQTEIHPITKGISFTAEMHDLDETYTCRCTRSESGDMTLTVEKPVALSGLTLLFENTGVTATYKGLTVSPNGNRLPDFACATLLYEILQTDGGAYREKKNCTVRGTIRDSDYSLTFSPGGLPLCAEIPDRDFAVSFQNIHLNP